MYSDTDYVYIYLSNPMSRFIKYSKANKTIVYSTDVSGVSLNFSGSYEFESDSFNYILDLKYMIDKSTGVPYSQYGITILDGNDQIIYTTTIGNSTIIREKNNKYYVFASNMLCVCDPQNLTITDEDTGKRITLKCEQFYHVPIVVGKNNKNNVTSYSFTTSSLIPSNIMFNQDDSITYTINNNNSNIEVTIREYELSSPEDCENIIIGSTTSTSINASSNMVLQRPAKEISL